ncbi:MAG: hypothetical protein DWI54_01480 [Chloroflexi bacterium]|nr:MAG: hypothetical protein DWI54_01480 [Chloroflexota bacterium]RLT33863.1 MAG: hypothetical protein DWI55_01370 [Chloroflexota bacterium]
MILEQRFGAAQIAVRATDDLLVCAQTSTAHTVDAIRREIFKTAWQLICQKQAVGSLVNLLNPLLYHLDSVETVSELQQTVVASLTTFRHQLTHRVPDTAVHSMSVLSQCHRVMLYGYSTTVLYALQHALRNGQRIDVVCVSGTDSGAHRALCDRIAAIGLSVTTLEYAQSESVLDRMDAVVVGADTLDAYGLINTVGTAQLATAAHAAHVPFYTFCTSEKFLPDAFFQGERLPSPLDDCTCAPSSNTPKTLDVTPIEQVTGVITERGSLPAPAIEAWFAAERIHPWLSGRGTMLDIHPILQP